MIPSRQLMNGTVLIKEDSPEDLVKNPSDYKDRTDYTNRDPHPFDRQRRLIALYKKTPFDFRKYPRMPKDVQEEMEKIERDVATGRE